MFVFYQKSITIVPSFLFFFVVPVLGLPGPWLLFFFLATEGESLSSDTNRKQ